MLLIVILAQFSGRRAAVAEDGDAQESSVSDLSRGRPVAFLSGGMLFYKTSGGDIEPIDSLYIQKVQAIVESHSLLPARKIQTDTESADVDKNNCPLPANAAVSFKTAVFVDDDTVVYFLSDGNIGALFEKNLITGEEKHLLSQNHLDLDHFHYDDINNRILCSSGSQSSKRNLASISLTSNNITHFTNRDSIDSLPCSFPTDPQKLVTQSSDVARSGTGRILTVKPASIGVFSTQTQQLESVVHNARYDFMQPLVHPNGNLFYIRRPYQNPGVGPIALISGIFLLPLRIVNAFFRYQNVLPETRTDNAFTTSPGSDPQRDQKRISAQSYQISAEKAHRQSQLVGSVQSIAPHTWQLISRDKYGRELVIANNVASYDISTHGEVIYTNGHEVFELTRSGSRLLFRNSLIERVMVW